MSPVRDGSEGPHIKILRINSAVNYIEGQLMVTMDILDNVEDCDPSMEIYLGRDARKEYDDAIRRAEKAVDEALELLDRELGRIEEEMKKEEE